MLCCEYLLFTNTLWKNLTHNCIIVWCMQKRTLNKILHRLRCTLVELLEVCHDCACHTSFVAVIFVVVVFALEPIVLKSPSSKGCVIQSDATEWPFDVGVVVAKKVIIICLLS